MIFDSSNTDKQHGHKNILLVELLNDDECVYLIYNDYK